MNFVAPAIEPRPAQDFTLTPEGKYTMALASLRLKTNEKGQRTVEAFFTHTEDSAKSFKGVNYKANLDATFADGTSSAIRFSSLANGLGISTDAINAGKVSFVSAGSAPEGKEWQGEPITITVDGITQQLEGTKVQAVVTQREYNGKTYSEAKYVNQIRS